jgi:hypothetical protein
MTQGGMDGVIFVVTFFDRDELYLFVIYLFLH